jgi:hypothetical protein
MIQKRGSRWRVVVQAGRDPLTGVRRQLSGSATTEREAVRLERRLRLQVQGGAVGTITLADLVTEWWASKPRLAPTTQANYRDNLDNHILPVLGSKRVEDIRPRLVGAFLQHLQAKKGLGVSLLPGIPDLGAYPTPGMSMPWARVTRGPRPWSLRVRRVHRWCRARWHRDGRPRRPRPAPTSRLPRATGRFTPRPAPGLAEHDGHIGPTLQLGQSVEHHRGADVGEAEDLRVAVLHH